MLDEYYISKLSFREDARRIDSVYAYSYADNVLKDEGVKDRDWLISRIKNNDFVYVMDKNEKGEWVQRDKFIYENGSLSWDYRLPLNIEKRNVFISFYNKDEEYKLLLEDVLDDLTLNRSVQEGDINSDNSSEYIRHLIQDDYLQNTTILIVLIGPNTKNRKHIDWEIYGALDHRVGDRYAGVLGLILPNHPDYKSETARYALMPRRLAANFKSGYAVIRDWTTNRCELQKYIEKAFSLRSRSDLIENSLPQMQQDYPDEI